MEPAIFRSSVLILTLFVAAGCRGDVGELCDDDRDCKRGLECGWIVVIGKSGDGAPDLGAGGTRCSTPCNSDADCGEGEECQDLYCVPRCDVTDDDCPAGTACLDGACAVTCEEESDCSRGTCIEPGGFCAQ